VMAQAGETILTACHAIRRFLPIISTNSYDGESDKHYHSNSPQRPFLVRIIEPADNKHSDAISTSTNEEHRPPTTLLHEEPRTYDCQNSNSKSSNGNIIRMDRLKTSNDEEVDGLGK